MRCGVGVRGLRCGREVGAWSGGERREKVVGVLHKRSSATHDEGDYLEPHNKETAVAIVTFRELCSV